MEQSLQKEKYSSARSSQGTKKTKKKSNNNNYGQRENISEIREESNIRSDKLSEDIEGISKDNTDHMISLKYSKKSIICRNFTK